MKVTAIMPCSRPDDLITAIPMFLKQDYAEKELLICMDEQGYTKDTSIDNRVFQWGTPGLTIGEKRNELCEHAWGEVIVHMDSDDMYASDWISRSVASLVNLRAEMTGLKNMYLASPNKAWFYKYKGSQPYVCGATMCYYKSRWKKFKFRSHNEGEDTAFCYPGGRIIAHTYIQGFTARITGNNTASHKAVKNIPEVPLTDLPFIK